MNLSEFKSKAKVEEVNTTNGWGFAGYFGKKYTYKKCTMRVARWSTRHQGTYPYNCFCYNGIEVTKKEFELKINKLK